MFAYLVGAVMGAEDDDSRLDALVDVALSVGRRQNDHAGRAFLGKTIYAVIVLLVEHPVVILVLIRGFCTDRFRDGQGNHFNRRV